MGLEQDFKKETGQDAYHKDQTLWNDYYIEWLESRIEQLTIPVVVGQSKQLKCDNCKCTPTVIHNTPSGRFCEACRPITL